MKLREIGVVLAATAGLLHSQTEPIPTTFDVASVKPSRAQSVRGSDGGPGSEDPSRYSYGLATPLDLIVTAYQVDYFQVSSKVPLDRQRFDLVAKVPEGASKEQFHVMMQNLLSERFHLRLHMESREFPAYELVMAKTGLKLKETESTSIQEARQPSREDDFPVLPPGRPGATSKQSISGGYLLFRMRFQQEPISVLARMIRLPGEPLVVDRTGLTGKYDFTFEFTRELPGGVPNNAQPPEPPVVPDLLQALEQQLGLQLVAKKLPLDVVVVDSIDKMPTEN